MLRELSRALHCIVSEQPEVAADPGRIVGLMSNAVPDAIRGLEEVECGSLGGLPVDGLDSSIEGLARRAGIEDATTIWLIALGLLPQLDHRVGRAIAVAHDDLSHSRPSLGLAQRLFDGVAELGLVTEEPAFATPLLAATDEAGAIARGIFELRGGYGDERTPLAQQEIALHPRVVRALAQGVPLDDVDDRYADVLEVVDEPGAFRRFHDEVRGVLGVQQTWSRRFGLLVVGDDLSAARAAASAVVGGDETRVLLVAVAPAMRASAPLEELARAVRRESLVLDAIPLWHELPEPSELRDTVRSRQLARLILSGPWPPVVHSRHPWVPPSDAPLTLFPIQASGRTRSDRAALWSQAQPRFAEAEAQALGASFTVTEDQVRAAVAEGELAEHAYGGELADHTRRAAHRQASARLVRFATRVTPQVSWDDLVLPAGVERQVRELERRIVYRERVIVELGYGGRSASRRGLVALFTGASGTGKTMAAEVLAESQGYDLFRVDLSAVVSKYIGETEQQLSQVFSDAEASSRTILFFDEADALFGRRSEVKDAHDRYANIEVNYLLQRVEAYDGLIVLASNLRQNMDPAFVRRLDAAVDFPFPDTVARASIWRRVLPVDEAIQRSLGLDAIAERYELAGGAIRNCSVHAAYRAAERCGPGAPLLLERDDLLVAIAREYQKLGRPVMRTDFGDAYGLVMDEVFATRGAAEDAAAV